MQRTTCSFRARFVARKCRPPSSLRLYSTVELRQIVFTESPAKNKKQNQAPNGHYTIFVRTWDRLRSPMDTLAIIQHLEMAFGPIEEFRPFKREGHDHSMGSSLMVRFRDAASAKRALKHTATIPIPTPPEPKDSHIHGGMGLDDLQPYLERQKFDPTIALTNDTENVAQIPNTMLITLSTAYDLHTFQPRSDKQYFISSKAATSFVKWAGFAAIKPVEEGVPLDNLDHVWMRRTVRRHARKLNLPNPLESQPGKKPTVPEPNREQPVAFDSKPPSVSGEEWVAPLPKPSTSKTLETTPSKHEAERESLSVFENTSSFPPNITETVELKVATTESVPVMTVHHEATSLPTELTTPPPAGQLSPKTQQSMPPPDDPISQALAAAQIQEANAILQQLKSPKPKQDKQIRAALPNSPKRQEPRATKSFLESEQSEDTKSYTDSSSGAEESLNTKEGANGRLKKFLGGWF